jgi:hypothetical protein
MLDTSVEEVESLQREFDWVLETEVSTNLISVLASLKVTAVIRV